jgi:hypothetical protein
MLVFMICILNNGSPKDQYLGIRVTSLETARKLSRTFPTEYLLVW